MKCSQIAVAALLAAAAVPTDGFLSNIFNRRQKAASPFKNGAPQVTMDRAAGVSGPIEPEENSVRQAYDKWRLIYNKGKFDAMRYENFKINYIKLAEANAAAMRKAKQHGIPEPKPLELNEHGDCSTAEYQAMRNGVLGTNDFETQIQLESMQAAFSDPDSFSVPTNTSTYVPARRVDLDPEADRIRGVYAEWCVKHDKVFNEERLQVFSDNLKQVEKYQRETGKVLKLNEHSDLTQAEYNSKFNTSWSLPKKSIERQSASSSESSSGVTNNEGIPDRVVSAYKEWCTHFGKVYDEKRLPTFQQNFLQVEEYYKSTGIAIKINEFADLSPDEFKTAKGDVLPTNATKTTQNTTFESSENMFQAEQRRRMEEAQNQKADVYDARMKEEAAKRKREEEAKQSKAKIDHPLIKIEEGAKLKTNEDFVDEKAAKLKEHFRNTYKEYCEYYHKEFDESRIPLFKSTIIEINRKLVTTGQQIQLDEYADLTPEEASTRRKAVMEARAKVEQETRNRAKEEARLLHAEYDSRKAAEAQRDAEEKARQRAEAAARLHAELERAKRLAEEDARKKAQLESRRLDEARRHAEETARIQAEQEAARIRELEAKQREEEEAKRLAEVEAAQARQRAEEEARRRVEEVARLQAEQEAAKLRAEQEARILAEQEATRLAEEAALAALKKAEQEAAEEEAARITAEQARRKTEEEHRVFELEAKLRAEADARRKAEEEAKRLAEENSRIKAAEQVRQQAREQAELAARAKAELDAKRIAEDEARVRSEEEARLLEEEAAMRAATEQSRIQVAEETRLPVSGMKAASTAQPRNKDSSSSGGLWSFFQPKKQKSAQTAPAPANASTNTQVPEKVREAYMKWAEFYNRPFEESRLPVFYGNLLQVEQYFKDLESNVDVYANPAKLNKHADRTIDEYKEIQAATATSPSATPPVQPKSSDRSSSLVTVSDGAGGPGPRFPSGGSYVAQMKGYPTAAANDAGSRLSSIPQDQLNDLGGLTLASPPGATNPEQSSDKVRIAYEQWCQMNNKAVDASRIPIFEENFLQVERYYKSPDAPEQLTDIEILGKLNKHADLTVAEYQQMQAAAASSAAPPPVRPKKSDASASLITVSDGGGGPGPQFPSGGSYVAKLKGLSPTDAAQSAAGSRLSSVPEDQLNNLGAIIGGAPSQEVPAAPREVIPDKVRVAYQKWCQYYDKPYEESRLSVFQSNLIQVEKYFKNSNFPIDINVYESPEKLNENADRTIAEYKQIKASGPGTPSHNANAQVSTAAVNSVSSGASGSPELDRARLSYTAWCKQFGKQFDETRLKVFANNLKEKEKYEKSTGKTVELNQFSDLTPEEFSRMQSVGSGVSGVSGGSRPAGASGSGGSASLMTVSDGVGTGPNFPSGGSYMAKMRGESYPETSSFDESYSEPPVQLGYPAQNSGPPVQQGYPAQNSNQQGPESGPDRVRTAYQQWCEINNKSFDESRVEVFERNFLQVENYYKTTKGLAQLSDSEIPGKLNEHADRTIEEFQQIQAVASAAPPPRRAKSSGSSLIQEVDGGGGPGPQFPSGGSYVAKMKGASGTPMTNNMGGRPSEGSSLSEDQLNDLSAIASGVAPFLKKDEASHIPMGSEMIGFAPVSNPAPPIKPNLSVPPETAARPEEFIPRPTVANTTPDTNSAPVTRPPVKATGNVSADIRAVYGKWCEFYGKEFNEFRVEVFEGTLLQLEKFYESTGKQINLREDVSKLNEYADRTKEEHREIQDKKLASIAQVHDDAKKDQGKVPKPTKGSGAAIAATPTPAIPDNIRNAYEEWCSFYNKDFEEARLPIFQANFIQVQKYYKSAGKPFENESVVKLNEYADRTKEEHNQIKARKMATVATPHNDGKKKNLGTVAKSTMKSDAPAVTATKPKQEVPESVRAAYKKWCSFYKKEFEEARLPIFQSNFRQVEEYYKKSGNPIELNQDGNIVKLNQHADRTVEEYKQIMASSKSKPKSGSVKAAIKRPPRRESEVDKLRKRFSQSMQRPSDVERINAEKRARESARKRAEQKRKAEEEAKLQAEAELKRKAEEEAKLKVEAELKRKAEEEEAKLKAEAELKRKAEEEAKLKAEEEQKRKAEEEAKLKAEAELKRKAEAEAKLKAEAELKRKAEAEAKLKAEAELKRKAEAEAKLKAEAELKRKAEAEAKLKAEAELKRKAEAEAKLKAEAELKRKAQAAAAKLKAEAELKRKAEAAAKLKAEAEQKRKAEAEAKLKAEAEQKRKAEAEAKLKAEQKQKAEEQAKLKAEAEQKQKAEAEARLKAEAEQKRKAREEAKLKAEAEQKRKAEVEAKLKAAAEQKRKTNEKTKLDAGAAQKRKAEQEATLKAEAAQKRKASQEATLKAPENPKVKPLLSEEEKARFLAGTASFRAKKESKVDANKISERQKEKERLFKAVAEVKRKAEQERRDHEMKNALRKAKPVLPADTVGKSTDAHDVEVPSKGGISGEKNVAGLSEAAEESIKMEIEEAVFGGKSQAGKSKGKQKEKKKLVLINNVKGADPAKSEIPKKGEASTNAKDMELNGKTGDPLVVNGLSHNATVGENATSDSSGKTASPSVGNSQFSLFDSIKNIWGNN